MYFLYTCNNNRYCITGHKIYEHWSILPRFFLIVQFGAHFLRNFTLENIYKYLGNRHGIVAH